MIEIHSIDQILERNPLQRRDLEVRAAQRLLKSLPDVQSCLIRLTYQLYWFQSIDNWLVQSKPHETAPTEELHQMTIFGMMLS